MSKNLFNELHFEANEETFAEVLFNPDKGFGYKINLKKKNLTPLQLETMDFLVRCQNKGLMGAVTLTFETESVGEVKPLSRRVEKIIEEKDRYKISNSY